jgi:predicted dehydrogenase
MTQPDRPVIGIVGGGIRGSMFAAAVKQNPQADLAAVCEPNAERREQVGQDLGVPTYGDLEAMLTGESALTALIIATPDFAHREPALLGIRHGLHLMIEKPLATTSEDAAAIVEAAEAAGTRIMVGFENRWNPKFAEIRRQLAVRGDRMVNQVINLNDTVFVPTGMLGWAAQSSPGWFLMPHTLDLAVWLSGAVPVEVFARGRRGLLSGRGVDTWDAITASFAMSDGSLLVLNSQWVLPESSPSVFDFRYELHTESVSYHVNIAHDGVTRYDEAGVSWPQFGVHSDHRGLHGIPIAMADDFIAALNGTDLALPDGRQGALITRAIEAVHASLSSGAAVEIGSPTA